MTDIDELRRSLHELADEARPAPLGPAALRGARRRHRRRLVGVGLVLLLAVGVAVPLGLENVRRQGAAPVAPTPGPHVVTSYASDGKSFVLDPSTGRYRPVDGNMYAVSPNLDRYAVVNSTVKAQKREVSELRIRSTSGDGPPLLVKLPTSVVGAAWSPDGAWMVLPYRTGPLGSLKPKNGFTSAYLVDTVGGAVQRLNLDLGGRYGTWAGWAMTTGHCWWVRGAIRTARPCPPRTGWPGTPRTAWPRCTGTAR